MQTVLKRGVAHGILKEVDGRYSMPIDTDAKSLEIAEQVNTENFKIYEFLK